MISLRQMMKIFIVFFWVKLLLMDSPEWTEFYGAAQHPELILYSVALATPYPLAVNKTTSSA